MMNTEELLKEAVKDGTVIYDDRIRAYLCQICNKPTTGEISAGQHVANSKHIEACARIAMNSLQNAPNSLLRHLSSDIKAAAEEGIIRTTELPGVIPGYFCNVCEKPLTGLAPLQQHLQGADHNKKLKRRQLSVIAQQPAGRYNSLSPNPTGIQSPPSSQLSNENLVTPNSCDTHFTTATQPQNLRRSISEQGQSPLSLHSSNRVEVGREHCTSIHGTSGENSNWNNFQNQTPVCQNSMTNGIVSLQTSETGKPRTLNRTFIAAHSNQSLASTAPQSETKEVISTLPQSSMYPNESLMTLHPPDGTKQQSSVQHPPGDPNAWKQPSDGVSTLNQVSGEIKSPDQLRTRYSQQPMALTGAIPRQPINDVASNESCRFSYPHVETKQMATTENSPSYSTFSRIPNETGSNHIQVSSGIPFSEPLGSKYFPNPNMFTSGNRQFTPTSPQPMTGGIPRLLNPQFVSSDSTTPLVPQLEPSPHDLLPSPIISSLAQQAFDDQVIFYCNESMRYKCQVCKKYLPGDNMDINHHICAKGHIEEGSKYAIQHPNEAPGSLVQLLPEDAIKEARAGGLIINQAGAFQCIACDKIFTGTVPLKAHLESFDHKNNKHNNWAPDDTDVDAVTKAFKDGLVICTDNSSKQVKCEVCQVKLNGNKNLADHLNGQKHKKKVMEQAKQNSNLSRQTSRDTSTGYSDLPDNSVHQPRPSSALLNPTNDEETDPDLLPYNVRSIPRGQVHIFNYLFTNRVKDPKERKGAKEDSTNLLIVFSKMGYEVQIHEDMTASETNDKLDEICQDGAPDRFDALVMFFLSHGRHSHKFYASDAKEVDLKDIWYKFTDTACPAMKKKPKIIFANFCRGGDEERSESDAIIDVPRDIVTIHAATEGITALRNPKYGTHFVRALCEILKKNHQNLDLRQIYYKLDSEVKSLGGRQPKWEDSRFRKFYF